ncbi:hypothetical protein C5167_032992 [Papaver somniferum]|uniref:RNA-dependent RNA polymerase n=1 Tax=Papaver somniferum TaxID=3469 RepID=A0A4Y7KAK5_PAPSO|nr:RNA-dependent RNA polymerase 2-like [Papaver somniferum]RZC69836.1 hypothetical protein C5167_032992 [Papaver somniferum]
MAVKATTLRVSNIPLTVIAKDLLKFFEDILGKDTVYALEIFTEHKNWKSKGHGLVQFETIDSVNTINHLSETGKLIFQGINLKISPSFKEISVRPSQRYNRVGGGVLNVGFLVQNDRFNVLESWKSVKVDVLPEKHRVEFWVVENGETYKLVVQFGDVISSAGYCLGAEEANALLLKLKFAPKIYHKISKPDNGASVGNIRYSIFKESFEFLWVRTTEFSALKSIGKSFAFVWQLDEGTSFSDIINNFPRYEGESRIFSLEQVEQSCSSSDLVPLIRCPSDSKLPYEILFQLNSLVHAQKLSFPAVNSDVIEILSSLSLDSATRILRKLRQVKSTSYEVISFIQRQLHASMGHKPSSSERKLKNNELMSCHRALITPTKIYLLGPEVESWNYVVKHFAEHVSDFMRVTFVEEDWGKLQSDAVTTSIEQGIFSKPYRTSIYHRILSVLSNGIVIGTKRFAFLAFSASQLRSSSVWMFASNDKISAKDIREWMGCFNSIRSVSKCAARMGQLFSSSKQALDVPQQDVETIPDIEASTDGIKYCFSDGIGKISLSFAKTVSKKCELEHMPWAFQIRYGGYKGVLVVDRNSFRKLSLRESMKKFSSKNRMLCITSCSQWMPCYLNREIVTLLSTLGIEDEKFIALQQAQIHLLDQILTNREVAIRGLGGMNAGEIKRILLQMLLQGYEPSSEPYLFMMLREYRDQQLSDIRSRSRIFVPKGRLLIGCLDETATLDYGQAYVRVTMTAEELQCGSQPFFHMVKDKTAIVVGKVVVTKNPCLHPGDIRVLNAVYEPLLEAKGLTDCLVFPQKGERPHPNECSGGDLDGDLYFVCWDENLIPLRNDTPMDYIARRPRIMDHDVTIEEIQKFFVDYMINDTLGMISTAHLVHADREPEKARSSKCLELATLHSMAVDFAKTGAPAEMPRVLRPREYPDFMEREDRAMYPSSGVLGKLYRATLDRKENSMELVGQGQYTYDADLEENGFEKYLETAESHRNMYAEKLICLMDYYGAETEEEMLTGNLRDLSAYLQKDKRRYTDMKDRIIDSTKTLQKEAKEWFHSSCRNHEHKKMASAWYHVTYHPNYSADGKNFLSFPWIFGDKLLDIKQKRRTART